jgi:hypothetical protein
MYTVSVVLSFPMSVPKAIAVLEGWRKDKERRKLYMRQRRKLGNAKYSS